MDGREWLARQLDNRGIGYLRADNALLRIEDLDVAAEPCDRFAHRAWPRLLDALARRVNIHLPAIAAAGFGSYYWCLDQAEIATDVMFIDRRSLTEVLPDLVRHASLNMSSSDVLRFLGRKPHPQLKAEVTTDTRGRPEGWRVKHRLARNWVKVFDKVSVLRVETTINNPREFRVLRVFTDDRGPARAAVDPDEQGGGQPCSPVATPSAGSGTPTWSPASICDDHSTPKRPIAAAPVSGLIAKLRGHGLVAGVPRACLYRPTTHGYRVMTAALTLHDDRFPNAFLTALKIG